MKQDDNLATGQITQSYYALWDKNNVNLQQIDRSDLLEQKILQELEQSGSDFRISTSNMINWDEHHGWYIDLVNTENGNTDNLGERQVSESIIRHDRVIFTTLLPSKDPCDFGGSSWLMEFRFEFRSASSRISL